MAIFSKKQNKEETKEQAVAATALVRDYAHVLRNPRITEKATMHSMQGVYVFDIATSATKRDIIRAVSEIYKVLPRKVSIATVPSKNVRSVRTGKKGIKSGGKKAYIYLKKGETITIA
jgi:large subunit ribosomal protein L23